jgi:hypothetical protein
LDEASDETGPRIDVVHVIDAMVGVAAQELFKPPGELNPKDSG